MTTKRKKKKTMSIIFIILLIISGVGGKYLMDKRTEHERQVAFLKAHEVEMTEYIKSQNEKIETVEYDWDSVEVGTIGNGTPQGAGRALTIYANFNKLCNSSIGLWFELDKHNLPQMKTMELDDNFRIEGDLYE
jgi:PBP1b-binding outer membrane lipoprotein LpoB